MAWAVILKEQEQANCKGRMEGSNSQMKLKSNAALRVRQRGDKGKREDEVLNHDIGQTPDPT